MKNQTIGRRLLWGFGIVVAFTILLGATALIQIEMLSSLISDFYNHPFTVSKTVREIEFNIMTMHGAMDDLVLAKTDLQRETAISYCQKYEQKTLGSFDILYNRFLGDKQDVDALKKVFLEWRPLRQEIINLVNSGNHAQAAQKNNSEGYDYIKHLDGHIRVIRDFADKKAQTFYVDAQISSRRHLWIMSGLMIAISGLSIVTGTLIRRSVTGPISFMMTQMKIIGKGHLEHKINLRSNDELGQFAQAFDQMTEQLNETTTSRNELNIANQQLQMNEQQLRAANQQLRASEQQLRAANQQLRASEQQLRAANQQLHATEQQLRATNQQLKATTEHAQAANEAKSLFLANMSHEIRTPMNAIIGFSDLLAEENLNESQMDYVNTIRGSGSHLLRIINDILDFSKIQAGKLKLELTDCSLHDMLTNLKSMAALKASEKKIEFKLNASSCLPQTIHSDLSRLTQCLINLTNNAIKFTDEGHVHVNVSVNKVVGKEYIQFDVEDTGIGVPPDKLHLIFESFTQADDSHSRRFGGTGLGLAITKQLAGLLGGDIRVSSEAGKGSVFSLRIPATGTAKK